MRKNMPLIPITNNNLKDIKPENIIAVTIASGGAMGDPGAIEITDKKLNIYYTHFGEISTEELERVIPFIKQFDKIFSDLWMKGEAKINNDWTGIYTGFGNGLFVNPKLNKSILSYIKTNYSNTDCSPTIELYTHWYDALKEVTKKSTK